MFSVGLLYSVKDFLALCAGTSLTPEEFRLYFKNYAYSTADNILAVTFKCAWTKITHEGHIELTERGRFIGFFEYKQALLLQLEDMIQSYTPTWGTILFKGRAEAKIYLPDDANQCFRECGLFDDLTDDIIKVWDRLTQAYRNFSQKRLTEIGRRGEKLSFDYEWERTKVKPIWQAVESNLAGFDILSVINAGSQQKLKIEVKATMQNPGYATIHITQHEWETAQVSDNYLFHFWHITESPRLSIFSIDEIEEHIPENKGKGNWESVEIPFTILIE